MAHPRCRPAAFPWPLQQAVSLSENFMTAQIRHYRPRTPQLSTPAGIGRADDTGTARAYDAAGQNYLTYADGDAAQPFTFSSRYSFADREIWRRIDTTLKHMAAEHRRTLRLLDVGCGPGTWIRRVALRARALGFTTIEAHGIDLSPAMLALARTSAATLNDPAITITFTEGDITAGLGEEYHDFDMTLCLYGVLNHLPQPTHARVAATLSRVTTGTLFTTVRTIGSLPTIYVDSLDRARTFHQDNDADWMEVDLLDGRHLGFPSHLFSADELRALFQLHVGDISLVGLDVFHSRFATNSHWNPPMNDAEEAFREDLEALEQQYCCDRNFINRASHILLVGQR
jgi:SAM-dependent methyltransferase